MRAHQLAGATALAARRGSGSSHFFLDSTFIDQNKPSTQTAGPLWGSPKLDLRQLPRSGGFGRETRLFWPETQAASAGASHSADSEVLLALATEPQAEPDSEVSLTVASRLGLGCKARPGQDRRGEGHCE